MTDEHHDHDDIRQTPIETPADRRQAALRELSSLAGGEALDWREEGDHLLEGHNDPTAAKARYLMAECFQDISSMLAVLAEQPAEDFRQKLLTAAQLLDGEVYSDVTPQLLRQAADRIALQDAHIVALTATLAELRGQPSESTVTVMGTGTMTLPPDTQPDGQPDGPPQAPDDLDLGPFGKRTLRGRLAVARGTLYSAQFVLQEALLRRAIKGGADAPVEIWYTDARDLMDSIESTIAETADPPASPTPTPPPKDTP
jgi:hypothetical protein